MVKRKRLQKEAGPSTITYGLAAQNSGPATVSAGSRGPHDNEESGGQTSKTLLVWEGIILGKKTPGEGMIGTVFGREGTTLPAYSDRRPVWTFRLGLKADAAAVP